MTPSMIEQVESSEASQAQTNKNLDTANKYAGRKKRLWIDLDNSPHVPFFLPILEELKARNFEIILTARNSYQVCELLKFHKLSCKVVGGHWGKHRIFKILGTLLRAGRLTFMMLGKRVDLALAHGSRAQLIASTILGIPSLTIFDYEHTAKAGFFEPEWVMFPEILSDIPVLQTLDNTLTYPGLKEDVYVPRLRPDETIKKQLGINDGDLVVTVRPPAIEAHYHNPEGEILLEATLKLLTERPATQVILLPRNERQSKSLAATWAPWIQNRKIIIPEKVVDGVNLIWCSDLVISGGGTMNREAAALGIPVYSIFRGKIGKVDRYLADNGRLTLIEKVDDLHTKLQLVRRDKSLAVDTADRPALSAIVNGIVRILDGNKPQK